MRAARRYLGLAATQAPRLVAATVLMFAGSAATLLYPQVLRIVFDGGAGGLAKLSGATLASIALLIVLHALSITGRHVLFGTAGERVVADLRMRLYEALLAQETAFFDTRATGDLVSRLVADTAAIQRAVTVDVSMALGSTVTITLGLALLVSTSPALTLLMLLVVPPVALGAYAYGRRLLRLSREAQAALAETVSVAEETLGSIRTVHAFAAHEAELRRYGAAVERSFERGRGTARSAGAFLGIASFAALAAAALVILRGVMKVTAGEMSFGALASFVVYTLMVAYALGTLSDLWAAFARASGAAERVFVLLDRAPSIVERGATPSTVTGDLRLENVTFAYPARPDAEVLAGLDLALRPGQVVALVGPSGAGKSTVVSLVLRLYDPCSGRVVLDGHDVRDLHPSWLRRHIAVVAQDPTLFSTTIAENIRYGRPEATFDEVVAAAKAANAHDFVSAFPDGYATRVGERGAHLSGGQRQRIAIARALLKDPRILVLDEATSALDAESEHLVRHALERLMRGRTTLVIAHRLSSVLRADTVLVLQGGRVVQRGTHRALFAEDGLYRRLVEKQFVDARSLDA